MNPRTGLGLVVAGLVLFVVGLVGGFVFAEDGGDGGQDAAQPGAESTTSTLPGTTASTSATSSSSTTSTTVDRAALIGPDQVRAFYDVFTTAVRTDDAATLIDRLHPAVFDLYGEDQCASFVEDRFHIPEVEFEVVAVGSLEEWQWDRDGTSTVIPDAVTVDLVRRDEPGADGVEQEAHLALAGDRVAWFTDCGDPVG